MATNPRLSGSALDFLRVSIRYARSPVRARKAIADMNCVTLKHVAPYRFTRDRSAEASYRHISAADLVD
jgi:hypothetical protein